MYVYVKSEPCLWTVGFYDPSGKWIPESDHNSPELASKRVSFLNGAKISDAECDHVWITNTGSYPSKCIKCGTTWG